MTGYGDASEHVDNVHYTVELRSVNNRYFKTGIRLPDELAGLEGELEAELRKRLSRGSITLTVRMHDPRTAPVPRVNDEVLAAYVNHLEILKQKTGSVGSAASIDLGSLLTLPGVLEQIDTKQAILDQARPAVNRMAMQACDKLTSMRTTEGRLIGEDLSKQCRAIEKLIADIRCRAPKVIEAYHQRLRGRIDDLLARAELKIEEKELIHEVAVFAEKADISEEVSRMDAHMKQFEQIVSSNNGQPSGRTLDFVAQEMLREANTISSKSNDIQISRAIVEIKGSIDRIKEQVQNVE